HLDLVAFIKHFPMIYERCKSVGIDIAKDWIPVVPAQHYLCGGIVVDKTGKTSIENLFACGECSRTGLHGANRLASNSLLEALVYSDKIYNYLANTYFEKSQFSGTVSDWKLFEKPTVNVEYIERTKAQLQLLMRQNAGIVRKDADLFAAKKQLALWQNEIEEKTKSHKVRANLWELYNLIIIAKLIVDQSIERTENRGGFVKIV
ncbi:FAD-binding protein, partial [Flavobacterium sp.]|uniref:FAD-binding protein n=1 Tax=Flavobacterium sp. TaxID=239 RepID=UPI00378EF536